VAYCRSRWSWQIRSDMRTASWWFEKPPMGLNAVVFPLCLLVVSLGRFNATVFATAPPSSAKGTASVRFDSPCPKVLREHCRSMAGPHGSPVCCCSVHPPSGVDKKEPFKSCLPSLVIVGAQKAGTTPLSLLLSLHPDVVPPRAKELNYYSSTSAVGYEPGSAKSLRWYLWRLVHPKWMSVSRAATGSAGLFTMDATPHYMALPGAIAGIAETSPAAKVIVMLRDPVERAWSEYEMLRRRLEDAPSGNGPERAPPPFASWLKPEMARLRSCTRQIAGSTPLPIPADVKNLVPKPAALSRKRPAPVSVIDDGPSSPCWHALGSRSYIIGTPRDPQFLYLGLYLTQIQRLHARIGVVSCKGK
jgi:hypothetical protein